MSVHFRQLKVQAISQETNDCVSIQLQVPEHLQQAFSYQQGQYLTFKAQINGQEVRRSYSICSSPLEPNLRVAVKKIEGGLFSTYANEVLKVNDVLEVMPPAGKFFTPLNPNQQKQYVAFAAGSGITPMLSIIKTTLQVEPLSQFTLIYGNKNRHSIIFKEALEALKNTYLQRFQLVHILSRERTDADIQFGRINADKCAQLFQKLIPIHQVDEFFICGPEAMIFDVKNHLEQAGVDHKKIHFELFSSAASKATHQASNQQQNEAALVSKITIQQDGRTFYVDLPMNGPSILDAALQQGADLPYACKGGVCCTCKAKVLEGSATMQVCWGLEPEEVEQGYILTCQAYPTTATLTVDFDAK